ncbi:MAG: DUF4149 domain-containing protein [Gammaproteobacteria bacterium]
MNLPRVGEKLIQTLWVGALWSVGYIVAPTLFAHLDSATAGRIAGELFTSVTWLSMICGVLLLIAQRSGGRTATVIRSRNRLIPSIMALLGCSEWIVRPLMEASRLPDGTPGENFGMLHGLSALLYLAASLLALLLVALKND